MAGTSRDRLKRNVNMGSIVHEHSDSAIESRSIPAGVVPVETRDGLSSPPANGAAHPDHRAAAAAADPPLPELPASAAAPSHPRRRWLLWAGTLLGLALGGHLLAPVVATALNTVSTDDAYVNGHVTLVAPRVPGQVARVLSTTTIA